ncbi:MAG: transcriptional repressor [Thermoleophilia bacterium]|jgi:Fe2+ or Zn2+ uptake regulation protein|nr:transcriptional repressor [Thermoleophilia bacterium]
MPSARTDEDLAGALRARGLRVTPQRLVIHRVLRDRAGHATAEQVLREVAPALPNVSLPTVYATLALLERLGAVRRVSAPGDRAVYDTRTDPHHHIYCRECGAVADLEAPLDPGTALRAAERVGFRPDWAELTLTGTCARCAAAQPTRADTTAK